MPYIWGLFFACISLVISFSQSFFNIYFWVPSIWILNLLDWPSNFLIYFLSLSLWFLSGIFHRLYVLALLLSSYFLAQFFLGYFLGQYFSELCYFIYEDSDDFVFVFFSLNHLWSLQIDFFSVVLVWSLTFTLNGLLKYLALLDNLIVSKFMMLKRH